MPVDMVGPITRMQFRFDRNLAPGAVHTMLNMWPEQSGALVGRPGTQRITANGIEAGGNAFQALVEWREPNGTRHQTAVVGGELWDYTQGVGWTKVISTANLTAATITLATTQVAALSYNGQLFVSDGVNTPFLWNGTAGAGLTKCTNCPVLYGVPVVYYGKIVGIKSTERNTLVWSEENDANLGYEAGGYSNAWTLTQTNDDQLTALAATNQALYVFRRASITTITGAVTPDFSSTGVRDSISAGIGTRFPFAMEVGNNSDIWFLDAQGRPWMLARGTTLIPIWQEVAAAYGEGSSGYSRLSSVHWPTGPFPLNPSPTNLAVALIQEFVVYRIGLKTLLVFRQQPDGSVYCTGVWVLHSSLANVTAMATWFHDTEQRDWIALGFSDGQVRWLSDVSSTDSDNAGSGQRFEQQIVGPQQFRGEHGVYWMATRVLVRYGTETAVTGAMSVSWITPDKWVNTQSDADAQSLQQPAGVGTMELARVSVAGINAWGEWVAVIIGNGGGPTPLNHLILYGWGVEAKAIRREVATT